MVLRGLSGSPLFIAYRLIGLQYGGSCHSGGIYHYINFAGGIARKGNIGKAEELCNIDNSKVLLV